MQVILHLPPSARRLPQFLHLGAAHTAMFNAEYVSVRVAYDLTHGRRVAQGVDERPERALLVRRGPDLEVGRGHDAQHPRDPAHLLDLGGDVGPALLGQRERDELIAHARDDLRDRAYDDDGVVGLAEGDPLQHGGGGDAVRVIAERHHDHRVRGQLGLVLGRRLLHADAHGIRDEVDAGSGEVEHLEQRGVVEVVEAAARCKICLSCVVSEQLLLHR